MFKKISLFFFKCGKRIWREKTTIFHIYYIFLKLSNTIFQQGRKKKKFFSVIIPFSQAFSFNYSFFSFLNMEVLLRGGGKI